MGSSSSTESRKPINEGCAGQWCHVYCWTTPLEFWGTSGSGSLNHVGGSWGLPLLQHWKAGFTYDDEVLVCDADDVEGRLKGKCERMKLDEFNKMCLANKKCLGKFQIPKQRVEENVAELNNHSRYDFVTNNCQKWLRALLKKMKVPDSDVYIDGEEGLFLGLAAFLFAGVGYSIYYMCKKDNDTRNELTGPPAKRKRYE